MPYAAGKNAWGISDRSGRRYRLNKMKTEWTGAKVGPDEFEPKHPQLFPPKAFPDPQALRDPRPETGLTDQRTIQWGWNPVGFQNIPGVSPPNNLVATGSVGAVTITGSSSQITVFTVTFQNYLGGNRYYIDGVRQPTLSLSEGSTYVFNWSAATSHPLRFSTTSDGTHAGGSEYTTGVTINTLAYTSTITVAVGAPTLFYYCQYHSQMGGQINTP